MEAPNLLPHSSRSWRPFFEALFGIFAVGSFVFGWIVSWDEPIKRASIGSLAVNEPAPAGLREQDRQLRLLTASAVNSVSHGTRADTVRFYEAGTGRAFVLNLRTGAQETLSENALEGFSRSWWVPGSDRVISAFDVGLDTSYRFYDYQTREYREFGGAVVAVAISPEGRRVAFADATDDAVVIYIADIDGSNARQIFRTRASDIELSWPQSDALVLASQRLDRSGRDLTVIGVDGLIVPLMSNREGLEYVWSPDGTFLLFSYAIPGKGITLWYRSLSSPLEVPLPMATSAKKCAWGPGEESVWCGVPTADTLSKDVPAAQTATVDDVVRYDMETGETESLYTNGRERRISVIEPLVSSSGGFLVFTNLFDRYLYSLEL